MRRWLPHLDSALIVVDEDGGYRAFLGADPQSAEHLADCTARRARLSRSHIMAPGLPTVIGHIRQAFQWPAAESAPEESRDDEDAGSSGPPPIVFPERSHRFYPQMIEWAVEEIGRS